MTLKQIINSIKQCAELEPNVNGVYVNDVYQLNAIPNVDYSCIVITQNTHVNDEDTITYQFYLFYVDRLINPTDGYDNQIEIQSRGIEVIRNIVNRFNEVNDDDTFIEYSYQLTPFNERFKDDCSGIYATINVITETQGDCAYL